MRTSVSSPEPSWPPRKGPSVCLIRPQPRERRFQRRNQPKLNSCRDKFTWLERLFPSNILPFSSLCTQVFPVHTSTCLTEEKMDKGRISFCTVVFFSLRQCRRKHTRTLFFILFFAVCAYLDSVTSRAAAAVEVFQRRPLVSRRHVWMWDCTIDPSSLRLVQRRQRRPAQSGPDVRNLFSQRRRKKSHGFPLKLSSAPGSWRRTEAANAVLNGSGSESGLFSVTHDSQLYRGLLTLDGNKRLCVVLKPFILIYTGCSTCCWVCCFLLRLLQTEDNGLSLLSRNKVWIGHIAVSLRLQKTNKVL